LWRQKASAQIIAVTGSNGKTTVKEMLAAILSVNAPVLATKGNLNNDIGVPLTLLRLNESHRYAVIEMGANHAGEIAFSSRYALADVAIINNVGAAHLEGFGSLAGVAQAKGEIVSGLSPQGTAVLNKDDEFFPLWQELAENRNIISFGFAADVDVTATEISSQFEDNQFVTAFVLVTAQQRIRICLKLAGQHNVKNALAAAAACLAMGISLEQIKQGLENLTPVSGRLQPYRGRLGNVIINDSYNANPSSLQVALEVLSQWSGEKWLILGAFGELGENTALIHAELGQLIKRFGVTRLFAVGEQTRHSVESFGAGAEFFTSQAELIARLQSQLIGNETLLIKGSRAQRMENVAASLIDTIG
jgi:UDP-N-acetylmuramoyl-tripeptide--D-alanyl-D-alanine ligase